MRFRKQTLIAGLLLVLATGAAPGRAAKRTLNSIAAVLELTNEEAKLAFPVHLRAQVTLSRPERYWLFVQQAGAGIYLDRIDDDSGPLRRGDWLEIEGVTARGRFAPIIEGHSLIVTGWSELP